MLDEPELKPCPFCGSPEVVLQGPDPDAEIEGYTVICSGCLADGGTYVEQEYAVEHWNRRPPAPEPAPAWISAHDRLPENAQPVLAYWPRPRFEVQVQLVRFYEAQAGLGPSWWCLDSSLRCFVADNIVTHWMPLPAAPEAGQ